MVENSRSSGGGDRGSHGLRARARQRRAHLDGGIVDAGQRGHRQRAKRHRPEQQDGEAQQRRHDRAIDEDAREVHSGPVPSLAAIHRHDLRAGEERNCPSVTTVSPGRRPLAITTLPPQAAPIVTGRISTGLSGLTAYTKCPCWPLCTASAGTTTAFWMVSSISVTVTNWPGHNVRSAFSNVALR